MLFLDGNKISLHNTTQRDGLLQNFLFILQSDYIKYSFYVLRLLEYQIANRWVKYP